jgi:uncharacterized protein (DUF169 family)
MESRVAAALGLEFEPVAIVFTEERPHDAVQFAEGRWGCVMWLFASAAKGTTAVADRSTFGCIGGGVGLGFGNRYEDWPGGVECFYRFLSSGNADNAEGRDAAERARPSLRRRSFESFLHGEGYVKTPELARQFVAALPITEVPARYVMFRPLAEVEPPERPEIVVFLADPDRLAALVVLANYGRGGGEAAIVPFAAGCQALGILPYREGRSAHPRAVIGLIDISARLYLGRKLGTGLMSFAAPRALFEEMEGNVAGSFLERDTWRELSALAAH